MKHFHKFLSIFMLLALVTAVFATPVLAFDGRAGNDVTIKKGEVVNDDLYVSAENFTLDGTVKGDVFVMGSVITINGTVEGDLVAAGQAIIINGKVADDARVAGAAIQVGEGAEISDDLIAAGASVETQTGSTVGGDLIVGSAQASLAGDVAGDVTAGTSALELSGSFGGDVHAFVDATEEGNAGPNPNMYMPDMPISIPTVNAGLTVDDSASIAGNLEYTSTAELPIPSGVVVGKVTRTEPEVDMKTAYVEPTSGEKIMTWSFDLLRSMVTLILFSLLLGWLFPKFMKTLPEGLRGQPWASLGWGIIAWAAFFFAILALTLGMVIGAILFGMLTLGGLSGAIVWVGLLSLFALTVGFVLVTSYLTKIIVGESIGKWIFARVNPALAEHNFWPSILGIVVIVLVIGLLKFPLLPFGFLGWLLNFAVILFGLGALWLWGRGMMEKKPAVEVQ
jgi:cytoskeletal protein CcmA (bactofilin family)